MSALETLKAARELISDPERWAKGWIAFDADGGEVSATNPRAVRWCAAGAVKASTVDGRTEEALHLLDLETPLRMNTVCYEGQLISLFNDGRHSHAEVLAIFDRAIAKLEAQS